MSALDDGKELQFHLRKLHGESEEFETLESNTLILITCSTTFQKDS